MCERLKQSVLKTDIPERVSGVRIPLPPPASTLSRVPSPALRDQDFGCGLPLQPCFARLRSRPHSPQLENRYTRKGIGGSPARQPAANLLFQFTAGPTGGHVRLFSEGNRAEAVRHLCWRRLARTSSGQSKRNGTTLICGKRRHAEQGTSVPLSAIT
jgi:hypothetical protein